MFFCGYKVEDKATRHHMLQRSETFHNAPRHWIDPDFNYPEFGVIEKDAGTNRFIMSVGQWVDRTKALGLIVKAGRYGGTFAHKDILYCDMPNDLIGLNLNNRGLHPRLFILHPFGTKNA